MNRIKKVSVATIVGIALLGTTVFASTGKVYNTSKGLVLRGSASKNGDPLATVPNDKEVEIIENVGEWYKVRVDGKDEGYLYAQFVKVIEDEPAIEEPVNQIPDENIVTNVEPSTTKTETRIYKLPLITASNIGTIPANTQLDIEKVLNNWAYVSYGNVKGWIRTYSYTADVVVSTPTEAEQTPTEVETTPQETPTAPAENTNLSFTKGYINNSAVNVRKGPSTSTDIVATLSANTAVTITAQTDEWYKITYGNYEGYIYKPLISETPTATSRGNEIREVENNQANVAVEENNKTEQPVVENTPSTDNTIVTEPETVQKPSSSEAGEKIAVLAKQYIGYKYVLGGTKPSTGFDCSGFVYYIFNNLGYSISRSLPTQANSGVAVKKSELQPGDIVFFNNTSSGSLGHVGIYIGDGRMVHAANSKRGVVTDTINSGYYNTYFYTARRIAN